MIKDPLLTKPFYLTLLIIGIINAIWLKFSNITIVFNEYATPIYVVVVCGVVNLFYRFVRPRLNIVALTGAVMFFVVTSSFLLVTSYLMATLPFPLQDQALNDIDLMLGFHFETFVAMLNQNETIVKILQICYDTKILQFLTIAVILSKSKPEYIIEFCYLFLVTLIVTFIIYMFIPAAGAYTYLTIAPESISNIGVEIGKEQGVILNHLKSQQAYTLFLHEAIGLVNFPSFHTILALLLTYATRGVTWLFCIAITLNITMLIATIPMGGHYLIDLIGGGALTLIVIWLMKKYSHVMVIKKPKAAH